MVTSSDSGSSPQKEIVVPQPPAARPWTPPKTTLPKELVERTAFLLQHGLGDPRGGEYRSAVVRLGSLWRSDEASTEIHGWVLPKTSGEPTWVVSTTGLVYSAESVGGPADLESDVEAIGKPPKPNIPGGPPRQGERNVTVPANLPVQDLVGLLLIAGRADLAERLHQRLPARALHGDFLSRWFDQAVTAHMAGDDTTALRVGRAILRERPAYEKEALARSGQRLVSGPDGGVVKTDEQFPYLSVLPKLVEDTERRLRQGPRPKLDIEALKSRPVEEQVRELIAHLDDVAARQWGQPGGVNLIDDPIVARLAEIGAPAGEALMSAMEGDERLTRSVSFGRDFFPGRNLIRVKDAAYAALRAFLEVDELPKGPDGQPSMEGLRKYWEENKGKSPVDRWFDTLADDRAGWRRWSEAETRLFDPVGVRRSGYTTWGNLKGTPKAEALRGRSNPSLSDLLEKRARDIVFNNSDINSPGLMLPYSLRIGTDLAKWEPPRSIPLLRDLTQAALAEMDRRRGDADTVLGSLVPALIARHGAGDPTAWNDYVSLMSKVDRVPSFDSKFLRPIVENPDDPRLQPARKMLTTPGSVFDVVGRIVADPQVAGYDSLLVSPALKLPEVREAVVRALGDKRIIGASWVDERGNAWVEASGRKGPAQGVRPASGDPMPAPEVRRPLRAADAVAHALARLQGAPKFQPFWTPAEKDAAIVRIREFLLRNQDRIDVLVGWPNNWLDPEEDRKLRSGSPPR